MSHTPAIDPEPVRHLLDGHDFVALFREHLGWDRHDHVIDLPVGTHTFRLGAVAEKRNFAVFVCSPDSRGRVPDRATRDVLERVLAKTAHEHLVIFADKDRRHQVWMWVRRVPGKPASQQSYEWSKGQPTGQILQRVLPTLAIAFEDDDATTLPDVRAKVAAAFDVEKVTKKFFERFQKEHAAFHKFIEGIKVVADRDWYASVMLNRLMFCYFIQKKGLLDGDTDYLRNRLAKLQATKGKDKFWTFYQHFLLRLFHEGLSTKPGQRSKDLDVLIGRIPYLNGGLFGIHEIEERYDGIEISDTAFENLFKFFDEYRWHLDERPLRENNEINPDVLGYIFEKYINQKQMGAYYTKEDITGYISQNTIIPYILDQAAASCTIAFVPPSAPNSGGSVWRLLQAEPDRYIYEPVRRGVIDDAGNVGSLPPQVAAGVVDVSKRAGWNKSAPTPFGLPTETWREHVARRDRCLDLRRKLAAGEVSAVNDLVTLNLDIRQFAADVIERCEGPDLLRAVWKAVESVTVLDPTCGSGAFLFAALNVLEPLYEACLDRMGGFLDTLARDAAAAAGGKGRTPAPDTFADFRHILDRVADHPNRRYFIFKAIIVNNLYGVDIMEEACEICKLRLFLKLVAQVEEGAIEKIEPLPDIDFNIRSGNTLVGFTTMSAVKEALSSGLDFGKDLERITSQAEQAASAFREFRQMHTTANVSAQALLNSKKQLRKRLDGLHDDLNRYCAEQFNRGSTAAAIDKWAASHQPFHWLVDFYAIISSGGFDVVIGNPPYVGVSEVAYLRSEDLASGVPDLYGHVLIRSKTLTKNDGRCGMIVPLSLCFSGEFAPVRRHLSQGTRSWYSSFDNIPAALFAGVSQRCTIWLGHLCPHESAEATALQRWRASTRASLFPNLCYSSLKGWNIVSAGIPRVAGPSQFSLAKDIASKAKAGLPLVVPSRKAKHFLNFAPAARNFMSGFLEPPPCLDAEDLTTATASEAGVVGLPNASLPFAALALFVGELHFWHWLTHGDGFHVTVGTVSELMETLRVCDPVCVKLLEELGQILHVRRFEALVFKKNAGKYVGNFNYRGHATLTRRADMLLLKALGADRRTALDVFDQVQRLLAINESAGEKSIPVEVKARCSKAQQDVSAERRVYRRVDQQLREWFQLSEDELSHLLEADVVFDGPAGSGD